MIVEFGYTHVSETNCGSCGGNYLAMEHAGGVDKMLCWCGSTCVVTFDSNAERAEFIAAHKVRT